jgi:hypothetical protein
MEDAGTDEAAARRYAGYQRVKEARDADVSPERLRVLAADPVRPVRLAVAKHPATPPDALTTLLSDVDDQVSWAALLHRSVPTEALTARFETGDESARALIAHHPNAPRDLRGRCFCPDFCFGASAFSTPLAVRLRNAWLRLRG